MLLFPAFKQSPV